MQTSAGRRFNADVSHLQLCLAAVHVGSALFNGLKFYSIYKVSRSDFSFPPPRSAGSAAFLRGGSPWYRTQQLISTNGDTIFEMGRGGRGRCVCVGGVTLGMGI